MCMSNSLYHSLYICILIGNTHVAMQVWDIGGQSIAGEMLDKYIFGADVSFYFINVFTYRKNIWKF